jgi:hypothetical protein
MTWSAVWPAAAGALAQEVLHWYRLRTTLDRPEVRRLLRSPGYWIVTVAMIVTAGAGTALLYGDRLARPDALFVLGAAFPMIFKRLVAIAATRPPEPAASAPPRPWWRAYLESG